MNRISLLLLLKFYYLDEQLLCFSYWCPSIYGFLAYNVETSAFSSVGHIHTNTNRLPINEVFFLPCWLATLELARHRYCPMIKCLEASPVYHPVESPLKVKKVVEHQQRHAMVQPKLNSTSNLLFVFLSPPRHFPALN